MVKIFKKQLQVKRARYVSWNQEIEAPRREILFISSIPTNKGISGKNFNKLLSSSNPPQRNIIGCQRLNHSKDGQQDSRET